MLKWLKDEWESYKPIIIGWSITLVVILILLILQHFFPAWFVGVR